MRAAMHPQDLEAGLSIGALADLTGVTPEAIRFYEREGIMPAPVRRGTGRYRRYGSVDVERLRFVRRARDLDFSLEDIRELMALASSQSGQPCSDVRSVAHDHLARVDARLAQLSRLRDKLATLVRDCDTGNSINDCALVRALNDTSR